MALVLALLMFVPSGPNLGLDRGTDPSQPQASEEGREQDGREPVLLPGMPVERTSELRSFHPLLAELVSLASPIRDRLRDMEFWNLRPDYRHGEFCISWEIDFSL